MQRIEDDDEDSDRSRKLRAVIAAGVAPALAKLALAAGAQYRFESDQEMRACIALIRLVPLLFGEAQSIEPEPQLVDPNRPPEEIARLMKIVEGKASYGD